MKQLRDLPTPDSYIYLASPYSGTDFEQELRYSHVKLAVKFAIEEHLAVYSPILHSHDLAKTYQLPGDAAYWELVNSGFINNCSEVWVLMMTGWEESRGVELEIQYARLLEKPVRFVYLPPTFDQLLVNEQPGE